MFFFPNSFEVPCPMPLGSGLGSHRASSIAFTVADEAMAETPDKGVNPENENANPKQKKKHWKLLKNLQKARKCLHWFENCMLFLIVKREMWREMSRNRSTPRSAPKGSQCECKSALASIRTLTCSGFRTRNLRCVCLRFLSNCSVSRNPF